MTTSTPATRKQRRSNRRRPAPRKEHAARFKAQAERKALAERKDLGLTARCRLNPRELAAAKDIDVVGLSELSGMPEEHRRHLLEVDTGAFSGVTVIRGEHKLIVVNDGHTPERQ